MGAPFLYYHPISYLTKAFELGRVFTYKYTVNFKFLPESIFLNPLFSKGLLLLLIILIIIFYKIWIQGNLKKCTKFNIRQDHNSRKDKNKKSPTIATNSILHKILHEEEIVLWSHEDDSNDHDDKASRTSSCFSINTNQDTLTAYYMISTLFVFNFLGIVTARSIHYQFYTWYFHTLPLLLFLPINVNTNIQNDQRKYNICNKLLNLCIMLGIECSYSITQDDFASPWTSILLQVCHVIILGRLLFVCRCSSASSSGKSTLNCFHYIREDRSRK